MADERIEQREPPKSLIALRDEIALPHNHEIFNYAIQGRNFEECLARIAFFLGIALDGFYDVPELCDVLVVALKKTGVLKVLGASGFTDGDVSKIDDRLIGIRRIEDKDTVRLENRDLILPEGVKRGELERAVARATKERTHPERLADATFSETLSRLNKEPVPPETKSDTLQGTSTGQEGDLGGKKKS